MAIIPGGLPAKPAIDPVKTADGYTVHFSIPQFETEYVDTLGFAVAPGYSGEVFARFRVPRYQAMNSIGRPALPVVRFYMAIAALNQVPVFEIDDAVMEQVSLNNQYFPAQEPWIKSQTVADRRFSIDRQYYGSGGGQHTVASVTEVFTLRGVPCVRVEIAPFEYDPAGNRMKIVRSCTLKIKTATDRRYTGLRSKSFEKYLKYLLVNFHHAVEPVPGNAPREEYLIISPPQWQKNLLEFITFRRYRYNVSLVTTARTGSSIVQIEEYIKNLNPAPSYILLVGDIDAIPSKSGNYASTDLYYSSTDADYYPEIFLGRFSIADSVDLANCIRKTMAMEHTLHTFPKRNLFVGGKDDVFGFIAERTHDTCIHRYFEPNGYQNIKRYINSNALTPKDSIVQDINRGVIFNMYSGHGLQDAWSAGPWSLTGADVVNLENRVYPFTCAFACFTGNYTVGECLAETFTRAEHGAALAIGASVSSMWEPDEDLQTGMIGALFDPQNPQTSAAACLNAGKMSVTVSNQSYHEMYNLMGDPALQLLAVDTVPYIQVYSPNGLEEWERNGVAQVFWHDNIDGPVRIDLLKNGVLERTLAASTPSDGVFEWKAPLDARVGKDFKIRIGSVDNPQLFDTSDANFSIIEEYIIKSFPYVENFDALDTPTTILPRNWEQLPGDDFDWIVFAGPTPSRAGVPSNKTGAAGDHTTDTGNYLYVEASDPNYPHKKTDFITCKTDFGALSRPVLIFWAHMFSDTHAMGDLHCDVDVDGSWHTDIAFLSGDHGDRWFAQSIDLASYKGDRVRFRFRGVTGDLWASDICVDDLIITDKPAFTSEPDTVAAIGAVYRTEVSAIDDDGQGTLKIGADTLPAWLTLTDNGSGRAVVTGIAQSADSGSHRASLWVDDGLMPHPVKQSFCIAVKSIALPLIEDQPRDRTVTEGETAAFLLSARGEYLRFRWQKNGVDISGARDSAYTTPKTAAADSGSQFRCIVYNPAGSDTSDAATLTVKAISAIVVKDFTKDLRRSVFNAAPNPVDLRNGEMVFLFNTAGCAGGEISIFDATGNKVAGKRFAGNVGSLVWDLRNERGHTVSAGAYAVVLLLDLKDGTTRRYRKIIGIKE